MKPLSPEAAAFADAHRVGRLATATTLGEPHVIPFCYVRAGDALYFIIDEKPKRGEPRQLKRLRNIAANPRVAAVIDQYDDDWSRLAYLLVHGEANLVADRAEYDDALARLRERYWQYCAMALTFDRNPVVRITIDRWHFWRANERR